MADKNEYLLVSKNSLPDVFLKVVEAKKLLETGRCKTASEAAERVNLSRSAFYKYKDSIFTFDEMAQDKIITMFFEVVDKQGVLSDILKALASANANVMTINQNIPVDKMASVTISFKAENMSMGLDELTKSLEEISGVEKIKILAGK